VDLSGPLCHDCGVKPGDAHDDGCDVARCLFTGGQRLLCGKLGFLGIHEEDHDCGEEAWTGRWPGGDECEEFGWWTEFVPPGPGEEYGEWVRRRKGDPGAVHDLNRLVTEARWDRRRQRWVLREAPVPEVILVRAVQTCHAFPCQWDATDASGGPWYLRYEQGRGSMGRNPLDERLTFTGGSSPEVIPVEEFCDRIGVTWAPEMAGGPHA
jgi:hypothetical protein